MLNPSSLWLLEKSLASHHGMDRTHMCIMISLLVYCPSSLLLPLLTSLSHLQSKPNTDTSCDLQPVELEFHSAKLAALNASRLNLPGVATCACRTLPAAGDSKLDLTRLLLHLESSLGRIVLSRARASRRYSER